MRTTNRIALVLALAVLSGCPGNVANGVALGPVTLTPSSAAMGCTGSSTMAVFTATQTNFTGPFTATSGDTTNETVAPGPGANQFTVTRVAFTTSTPVNITVTGAGGQTATFAANNVGCICMRHHDMWNGAGSQR